LIGVLIRFCHSGVAVGASAGGTNVLLDILSLGEPPVSTSSVSANSLTGTSQPATKDPFAASLMDLADPPLPGVGQSGVNPGASVLGSDNGPSGVDRDRKSSVLDDLGVGPSGVQSPRRGSLMDDFNMNSAVPASTSGELTSFAVT
jgi:hypothetical protein